MSTNLVLSLFPGLGLLDRAFEEAGFTIVRGPDLLWGGDVRKFHAPAGVFAGVIGGPPCQVFSEAPKLNGGSKAVDLVPEFIRIVSEAQPRFVVMENVRGALKHKAIPGAWWPAKLRDYDCGGETLLTRFFWTWPFAIMEPGVRAGSASLSVLASTCKGGKADNRRAKKGFLPGNMPTAEYGRLQGCEGLAVYLQSLGLGKQGIIHMLGNGVPLALGRFVAKQMAEGLARSEAERWVACG